MSFDAFHTVLNSIDKTCKCMQTSIIQNTKETLSRNKKNIHFAFFIPSTLVIQAFSLYPHPSTCSSKWPFRQPFKMCPHISSPITCKIL